MDEISVYSTCSDPDGSRFGALDGTWNDCSPVTAPKGLNCAKSDAANGLARDAVNQG